MTDNDLLQIERAIGRPLSAAVRRFYLAYPQELWTTTRAMGSDPEGEPCLERPADYELSDSAEAIIAMNASAPTGLQPLDWTSRMLVIGAGGCGEIYWVDLDAEHGPVYRFESGEKAEYSEEVAD